MSRILLVLAVLLATAGAVVAYGDPHQIARAKSMMNSGDNNEAKLTLMRAKADADLAMALAKQAAALDEQRRVDEKALERK